MNTGTQAEASAAPERRPILVAVDFSDYSEAALVWAASEAIVHDVPLIVLHVAHDPSDAPGTYRRGETGGSASEPIEDAAARLFSSFLTDACARHENVRARAPIETRVVVGVPATRILEVADEVNARHIVMGSHGRTGIKRLLLGSKAADVVQRSPVPVTIVKLREVPDAELDA